MYRRLRKRPCLVPSSACRQHTSEGTSPHHLRRHVVLCAGLLAQGRGVFGFVEATLVDKGVREQRGDRRRESLLSHIGRLIEAGAQLALGGDGIARQELDRTERLGDEHRAQLQSELVVERPGATRELTRLVEATPHRARDGERAEGRSLVTAAAPPLEDLVAPALDLVARRRSVCTRARVT